MKMQEYIATFFTHHDAVCCVRILKKHNIPAELSPVPRALSSSCGTCARFRCEQDPTPLLEDTFEQLFQRVEETYALLADNR